MMVHSVRNNLENFGNQRGEGMQGLALIAALCWLKRRWEKTFLPRLSTIYTVVGRKTKRQHKVYWRCSDSLPLSSVIYFGIEITRWQLSDFPSCWSTRGRGPWVSSHLRNMMKSWSSAWYVLWKLVWYGQRNLGNRKTYKLPEQTQEGHQTHAGKVGTSGHGPSRREHYGLQGPHYPVWEGWACQHWLPFTSP